MVRVRSGPAGMTGLLFFCAAAGEHEATAETRDNPAVRTKIALFAVFTDWIVRENERLCLAADEIDVALVSGDRDRSPPVTDVAGNSASFAPQFQPVVPESAPGAFLGGRGRHQMKSTIAGKLQRDVSLGGLEFISAAGGKFSVEEDVAGSIRGKDAGGVNSRQRDVA